MVHILRAWQDKDLNGAAVIYVLVYGSLVPMQAGTYCVHSMPQAVLSNGALMWNQTRAVPQRQQRRLPLEVSSLGHPHHPDLPVPPPQQELKVLVDETEGDWTEQIGRLPWAGEGEGMSGGRGFAQHFLAGQPGITGPGAQGRRK